MRPALDHRAHEGFNELIVGGTAHALVPPADVNGIPQALGIVGAHIEHDRQSGCGVQTATRGIKREFADRNTHAACALIAEAEDALAIGHDNGLNVVETRVGKNALDVAHMEKAEEETARLAEGMAEFLAAKSYRGRVDDRQHAGEIMHQQGVEQNLDAVLEAAQKDVALKIAWQLREGLHAPGDLLVEGCDIGREQSVQLESVSFLVGKSGSFVEQRIVQKLVTEKVCFNERAVGRVLPSVQYCGGPPARSPPRRIFECRPPDCSRLARLLQVRS